MLGLRLTAPAYRVGKKALPNCSSNDNKANLALRILPSQLSLRANSSQTQKYANSPSKPPSTAFTDSTQHHLATHSLRTTPKQQHDILARQRVNRPVAPHLEVYDIGQTYLGSSAWMRITGCALSGVTYIFFSAYLLVPLVGWHLDSAALVSAFANLPFAVSSAIKFLLAFPLSFHLANGVRQLCYDVGVGFAKTTIAKAEYAVWTAGVLGGLGLTYGL
ncbi:hypothetical protein E4U37_002307 [Claviceps purpurea]|nr:hypothetical protein E4U37_002307 [Claviceps purpurea]